MNIKLLVELDTLSKFLLKQNPHFRNGQALMNSLREINPELYQKITTTDDDCFYLDEKIQNFFERILNS